MKFSFQKDGKTISISTDIRVKESNGSVVSVDTMAVLGSRHIIDYDLLSDNRQSVTLSEAAGIFSSSLLSSDGKKIKVILDKSQGILNPYLSISSSKGEWSLRESTKNAGGEIVITSVKYPDDLTDFPEYIPIESSALSFVQNQGAYNTADSKTNVAHDNSHVASTSSNATFALAAGAALLVGLSTGKGSREKSPDIFIPTQRDDVSTSRSRLVSRLRGLID